MALAQQTVMDQFRLYWNVLEFIPNSFLRPLYETPRNASVGSWLGFWLDPALAEQAATHEFRVHVYPTKRLGFDVFRTESKHPSVERAQMEWRALHPNLQRQWDLKATTINRLLRSHARQPISFAEFLKIKTAVQYDDTRSKWTIVNERILSDVARDYYNPDRPETSKHPRGWWVSQHASAWGPQASTRRVDEWDRLLYGHTPILLDPPTAPDRQVTYRQYQVLWQGAKKVHIVPRISKRHVTSLPLLKPGEWFLEGRYVDERRLVLLLRDRYSIDWWNRLFFGESASTLAQQTDRTEKNLQEYYVWLNDQESSLQDWPVSWVISSRLFTSHAADVERFEYKRPAALCADDAAGLPAIRLLQIEDLPHKRDWSVASRPLHTICMSKWTLDDETDVFFNAVLNANLSPTFMFNDVPSVDIDADSEEWWQTRLNRPRNQIICLGLVTRRIDIHTLFPLSIAETREVWWPKVYEWWFRYSGDLRMPGAADKLLEILWAWAPVTVHSWSDWVALWPGFSHRNSVLIDLYKSLVDQTGQQHAERKAVLDVDRRWASHHLQRIATLSSIIHHLAQQRRVAIGYMVAEEVKRKEDAYTGFVETLSTPYVYQNHGPSDVVVKKAKQELGLMSRRVDSAALSFSPSRDEKDVKVLPSLSTPFLSRQFGGGTTIDSSASLGGAAKRSLSSMFDRKDEKDDKQPEPNKRSRTYTPGEDVSPRSIEQERQVIMKDSKGMLRFVPETELKTWADWVTFFIKDPESFPVPIPQPVMPTQVPIRLTDNISIFAFLQAGPKLSHRLWTIVTDDAAAATGISSDVVRRDTLASEFKQVPYSRGFWLASRLGTFYAPTTEQATARWNLLLYGNNNFTMEKGPDWTTLSVFLDLKPERARYLSPAIRKVVTPDQNRGEVTLLQLGYIHIPPSGSWIVPIPTQQQTLNIPVWTRFSMEELDRTFFGESFVTPLDVQDSKDHQFTVTEYLTFLDRSRQPPIKRPMIWTYDALASTDTTRVFRRPDVPYASQICLNSDDYITQEAWPVDPRDTSNMCTIYIPTSSDWAQFPKQGHCFAQKSLVHALDTINEPIYEWLTDDVGPNPVGERFYKLFYPNVLIDQASYRLLAEEQFGSNHRYFLLIPTRLVSIGTISGHGGEWGSFHGRSETIHSVFVLPIAATRESWWVEVYRWWWTYSGDLRVLDGKASSDLMGILTRYAPGRAPFEIANGICLNLASEVASFELTTAFATVKLFTSDDYVGKRSPVGISALTILVDIYTAMTTNFSPNVESAMITSSAARYLFQMDWLLKEIGRLQQERTNAIAYASSILLHPTDEPRIDLLVRFKESGSRTQERRAKAVEEEEKRRGGYAPHSHQIRQSRDRPRHRRANHRRAASPPS